MRFLHKIYANLFGYFWLPCGVCGKHFGGHEVVFTVPLVEADGRAYSVCSHECGRKAQAMNDANGHPCPYRIWDKAG